MAMRVEGVIDEIIGAFFNLDLSVFFDAPPVNKICLFSNCDFFLAIDIFKSLFGMDFDLLLVFLFVFITTGLV